MTADIEEKPFDNGAKSIDTRAKEIDRDAMSGDRKEMSRYIDAERFDIEKK